MGRIVFVGDILAQWLLIRQFAEGCRIEGDWSDQAKKSKAVYVASMYGFEFANRVGEYTHSEPNLVDHCARVDDSTFAVDSTGGVKNIPDIGLSSLMLVDSAVARLVILECRVKTLSSKAKTVVKPTLIGRRSPEEATFLDDLA